MTRRRTLRAIVAAALVAVATIVVGVAVLVVGGGDEPDPSPSGLVANDPRPQPASPAAGAVGAPTRLRIPAIEVDAPVVPVGTTAENAQEVPGALDVTGWWREGVQPGAPGNAVIVGHTASSDDGVFDALVDVTEGDRIVVEGPAGQVTFRVTEVDDVRVEDFASVADDIYRADGPPGLVLLTCGDWNGTAFETTVIVRAETV